MPPSSEPSSCPSAGPSAITRPAKGGDLMNGDGGPDDADASWKDRGAGCDPGLVPISTRCLRRRGGAGDCACHEPALVTSEQECLDEPNRRTARPSRYPYAEFSSSSPCCW
jgi:hypothetical protein